MSTISDFLKKCKIPFIWTIGYIFVTWAILHILFGFEMFSRADWIRISHAHLRGLGGLTFSLIIATTIPLYIATTTIVIRTQKPLLAIPMPKIIAKIMEKIFTKNQPPQPIEQKTESVAEENKPEPAEKYPTEMRAAFMRARMHPNRITAPICNVCSVTPNIYPDAKSAPDVPVAPDFSSTDLPLPPDFDIDSPTQSSPTAPVFQDINFYDDDEPDDSEINTDTENDVIDYLGKNNSEFDVLPNNIILTDNAAIAVHNDSDFWIMDEPIWFASGKTRESPIDALRATAAEHNVRAVLYLASTNIMNFEKKRAEWTENGIHVITKLEDL